MQARRAGLGPFSVASWPHRVSHDGFARVQPIPCAPLLSGDEQSLHRKIGSLYHLGPFRGVIREELAEFGWRRGHRDAAELGELGLHLWIGERRRDRFV